MSQVKRHVAGGGQGDDLLAYIVPLTAIIDRPTETGVSEGFAIAIPKEPLAEEIYWCVGRVEFAVSSTIGVPFWIA